MTKTILTLEISNLSDIFKWLGVDIKVESVEQFGTNELRLLIESKDVPYRTKMVKLDYDTNLKKVVLAKVR